MTDKVYGHNGYTFKIAIQVPKVSNQLDYAWVCGKILPGGETVQAQGYVITNRQKGGSWELKDEFSLTAEQLQSNLSNEAKTNAESVLYSMLDKRFYYVLAKMKALVEFAQAKTKVPIDEEDFSFKFIVLYKGTEYRAAVSAKAIEFFCEKRFKAIQRTLGGYFMKFSAEKEQILSGDVPLLKEIVSDGSKQKYLLLMKKIN